MTKHVNYPTRPCYVTVGNGKIRVHPVQVGSSHVPGLCLIDVVDETNVVSRDTLVRALKRATNGRRFNKTAYPIPRSSGRYRITAITRIEARILLEFYTDTRTEFHKRSHVVKILEQVFNGLEPYDVPARQKPLQKDPFANTLASLEHLPAALKSVVAQAVAEALNGAKISVTSEDLELEINLSPKDLELIRKVVREEIKTALATRVKLQGTTALDIVGRMNSAPQQLQLFEGGLR